MPYKIRKVGNELYKVCKKDGSKCFSKKGLPLETAKKQLKAIGMSGRGKEQILNKLLKIKGLYLVGSAGRNENYNDLDFITENDLKTCFETIKKLYDDADLIRNGTKYIRIEIDGVYIDVWKAENKEELKAMKIMRTIEKGHNIGYKKLAKKQGYNLNDKGLFKNNERINFKNEKELRKLIGLGKPNSFEKQLEKINLTPKKYLKMAQFVAKHRGYNPDLLKLCNDGKHKLEYNNVPFGAVNYNDKIIYTWLEFNNKIPKGTTRMKYINYRKRSVKMMKESNNKYSASSLSYFILW